VAPIGLGMDLDLLSSPKALGASTSLQRKKKDKEGGGRRRRSGMQLV